MTNDDRLWRDFTAICDTGGRLTGTPSEHAASALLKRLGAEASGVPARAESFAYRGWSYGESSLTDAGGTQIAAHPLVRSASSPEIEAEVIDLGRGEAASFEEHRAEIPGRIVLVRHELMFNPGTIHRRMKYRAAVEAGAIGFLIAGPLEDTPVAGSSGRGSEPGIPAMGISGAGAERLRRTYAGHARARMSLRTTESEARAENLFFDMPGRRDEWVVLSAHIDGHDIGESAIDNASGLAVAIEVVRRVRASGPIGDRTRGLRLAFFNAEEWALTGSARHTESLTDERAKTKLVVNLDSVAGGRNLTALTSGFSGMEPFLLQCADALGMRLRLYRPLQANSDHANYARVGIPAFRLVAGFAEAHANTKLVLTSQDTRDAVDPIELLRAAKLVEHIVFRALSVSSESAEAWRRT